MAVLAKSFDQLMHEVSDEKSTAHLNKFTRSKACRSFQSKRRSFFKNAGSILPKETVVEIEELLRSMESIYRVQFYQYGFLDGFSFAREAQQSG